MYNLELRFSGGFLRRFGGLIHGGAYFRNFTVLSRWIVIFPMDSAIHLLNRGQNLKFLHWESIFIGNLPGSALHALLLQYIHPLAILRMCFLLVLRHPYPFFRSFNAQYFASIERFGG